MSNNKKLQSILETLEEKDRIEYIDKIKKYKNECGCSMGGFFSLTSIFLYLIYNYLTLKNLTLFVTAKIIFLGILITIVAGLLGKIIGITIARIKLFMLFHPLLINVNKKNI